MSTKNYFQFDMEGSRELDRMLASLPAAVEKNQLKAGLRRNAKPILRDMKTGAGSFSQELAASIKIRTMTGVNVPAALAIGPDPDHWWGYLVEYGTGIYGPKRTEILPKKASVMSAPGLEHPIRSSEGFRAHPWARPAWEKNKFKVRENFINDMITTLEKFSARLLKQSYAGKLSKAAQKALGL